MQIVRYCIQDVILLAGVFEIVQECGELDVLAVHRTVNARGIAFDVGLARKLMVLELAATDRIKCDVDAVTAGAVTGKDLRRVKFLIDWLAEQGIRVPNLQKETISHLLDSDLSIPADVRSVLEARLSVNRITASKLQAAIDGCDGDGRLRDQLVYYGAHTGRWSGRGVQPHNLPKPVSDLDYVSPLLPLVDDYETFQHALPAGVSVADAISGLIRPCFRAQPGHVLCIGDFAGIEARGTAWCADEQRQLELFAEGGDNYCDLASQIYGYTVTPEMKKERAVGKVAVLGCGYGMAAETFAANCTKKNVNLAAASTTPEAVIESYRDRYPAIAGRKRPGSSGGWREGGLWSNLELAVRRAINGNGPSEVGKCRVQMQGSDLLIRLPSGRLLYYRNAHIERFSKEGVHSSRHSIVFDGPVRPRESTYGGKLTENIVSAICRDLLATAIINCERAGLPVVLHVHDEIVIEVPADQAESALRQLLTIMSTPPAWAAGFPIEVEGFGSERYFKSPPRGTRVLRGRDGQTL
ncbi:MAG: hypothetical protein HY290_04530 [Planctomycetia bacterium]|nr:hypothetical protein [Planctomycetia bacterium]